MSDSHIHSTLVGQRRPPEEVPRLVLMGLRGSLSGQTFTISDEGAVLGRLQDCTIVLDPNEDCKVSGRHGRIDRQEGRWLYTDLGSTNGSLVNAHPVGPEEPVELHSDDVLELGEDNSEGTVAFKIEIHGEQAGVHPSAAPVTYTCKHCNAVNNAPRSMMGRVIPCPGCGESNEVPLQAKLFSDSSPANLPKHPSLQRPSAPAHPSRNERVGGIWGKVQNVYNSIQDRRQAQQELNNARHESAGIQKQVTDACHKLGVGLWTHMNKHVRDLSVARPLCEGRDRVESIEHQILAYNEQIEQIRQSTSDWMNSWQTQVDPVRREQEQTTSQHEEKKHQREDAQQKVLEFLKERLTCTDELRHALQEASRENWSQQTYVKADKLLLDIVRVCREVADSLEQGAAEMETLCKTLRQAAAAEDTAAAGLAKIEERYREMETQREEQEAKSRSDMDALERQRADVKRQEAAVQSEMAAHYIALGRNYILQTTCEPVEAIESEFGQASQLVRKEQALQKRIGELEDQLSPRHRRKGDVNE